ncbi:MAG: glycosyltransferase [Planctomycetes bacterium]|nr:glycosyltransferase [Planctomycetota bacterium]
MVSFGVCMIVRDEEAALPRALGAAREVVDELVVLDTGSRDRSAAIARDFGATIGTFAWCDDFAAARNAALRLATARWILVLDADEELVVAGARAALESFVARPGRVGQVEIENVDAANGASRVLVTRFFPNDGRHRYVGRVHEQLVCCDAEPARAPLGVRVLHHGYSSAALVARDKLARNRALLERTLADAPDDAYAWHQLGKTEHVAGRHAEALRAFEQALARADDADAWAIEAVETASYSLRALGRSAHALALLAELETTFASRADTCFLLALLRMDTGDLQRAESGFLRALELGGRPATGGESVLSAATSAPAFNLGVMREAQGDAHGARRWYERALAYDPNHREARAALARVGGA